MIVEFLFWSTPEFLSYIIALAVLLAALVTVGLLTKNSELIVMRACGISIYRTALPWSRSRSAPARSFSAWKNGCRHGQSARRSLEALIRTGTPQTFGVLNRKWIVGTDGEVYHYQYYDPRERELHSLAVFEFDPQTRGLKSRMFVQKATYDPDREPRRRGAEWLLSEGWKREFDPKSATGTFTASKTSAPASNRPTIS